MRKIDRFIVEITRRERRGKDCDQYVRTSHNANLCGEILSGSLELDIFLGFDDNTRKLYRVTEVTEYDPMDGNPRLHMPLSLKIIDLPERPGLAGYL